MNTLNQHIILILNGGSSSIKFALYDLQDPLHCFMEGKAENIGTSQTRLGFHNLVTGEKQEIPLKAADFIPAANYILYWLEQLKLFSSVRYVAHRIVHGMNHIEVEKITPDLIAELKEISAYAPEHLPNEIKLIELIQKLYPDRTQFACFDTAFHTTMPPVAKLLPIPRRFQKLGIQRYGFHGLSYAYVVEELKRIEALKGKMILLHLGNGASIAAIKDGKSVDTSMGFTPTAGIPMSTRTGDLDPGLAWFLMKSEKLNPDEFNRLINQESGLLGVSGSSADMKILLEKESTDSRAAEAVELFCYQARKWIGAYAAVLGGIEAIVFTGGIGENASVIRERICAGLEFIGIKLDQENNRKNEPVISSSESNVTVHVMKTNEEWMIARLVFRVLEKEMRRKTVMETEES